MWVCVCVCVRERERERILWHWSIAHHRMTNKAFKGLFMKIEAPNSFVEWTENSRCHFGLEKAICCQRRRSGGLSYMLLSVLKGTVHATINNTLFVLLPIAPFINRSGKSHPLIYRCLFLNQSLWGNHVVMWHCNTVDGHYVKLALKPGAVPGGLGPTCSTLVKSKQVHLLKCCI